MRITIFLSLVLLLLMLAGCRSAATKAEPERKTSPETAQTQKGIAQVSVTDAKKGLEQKKDAQFIDVRTPEEYAGGHAVGAKNFPLNILEAELGSLDTSQPIYVICETGRRSQKGAEILQRAGFKDVYNITGGTSEWIAAGLPTEK